MPNNDFTDEEIRKIIHSIAEPSFRYFLKRVNKEILHKDDYKKMSVTSFVSILTISMASTNANMLRWIENFTKIKTGNDINFFALKMSFLSKLDEHLKKILQ